MFEALGVLTIGRCEFVKSKLQAASIFSDKTNRKHCTYFL